MSKIHPIWWVLGIGGVLYWRRQKRIQAHIAESHQPAIDQNPTGFVISPDCQRLIVTNGEKLQATVSQFYRDQKLANLAPGDNVADVPWAMTVNFFEQFAPACMPSTPTQEQNPPLSLRLMQAYIYMGIVAQAVADELVSMPLAAQLIATAQESIAQANQTDWEGVFGGTVPWPAGTSAGAPQTDA